jgi:predicted nucleotidyltransferase
MEGYPPATARDIAARAADVLTRDSRVRLVYLFGSAADPASLVARDVDLAVWTEPPLTVEDLVQLRAQLVDVVHARIDLVSLNDAPIVLAKEVADHGICLHAANDDIETDFVIRARARFWDFEPFLKTQWNLAGLRLEERLRGSPT